MNQNKDGADASLQHKPWWVDVWTHTPKWLILVIILALLALLIMTAKFGPLLWRGEPLVGFGQDVERALNSIATPENQYTGFYRDWQAGHGHTEKIEQLWLAFSGDDLVLGFSRGQKPGDPQSWLQRGYYKGDTLTLAYKSQGQGERLGSYLLQRHASQSLVYVGFWEGFKSGLRQRCPYVLVKGQVQRDQLEESLKDVLAEECVLFHRDSVTANFPLVNHPVSVYRVKMAYEDFAADYVDQLSAGHKACIQQYERPGIEPGAECKEVISTYRFLLPYQNEEGHGQLFIYPQRSVGFAGVLTYRFPGEDARIVIDAETAARRPDGGWYLVFKQPKRLVDFGDSVKLRDGDTWTVDCAGSTSLCEGPVNDPRNHLIRLGLFEMTAELMTAE